MDENTINDTENITPRYELVFWLRDENAGPLGAIVAKHGGLVFSERPLVKGRLAYPIKKEQYAFLGAIQFSIEPGAISRFSNDVALEPGILRSVLNRVDVKKEAEEKKMSAAREAYAGRRRGGVQREPRRAQKEQILTNEALEKKIEEILQ